MLLGPRAPSVLTAWASWEVWGGCTDLTGSSPLFLHLPLGSPIHSMVFTEHLLVCAGTEARDVNKSDAILVAPKTSGKNKRDA